MILSSRRFCRVSCVCCCLFFFFKQKTAYEMRISDWSADVCSSDDPVGEQLRQRRRIVHLGQQRRARGYAEGVACRQVGVALQPVAVGHRLAHRLGRLPRLGASLRRRIASTHSPISRSEEHTSELQSLMRISYAVLCLKKK